MSRYFFHVHDGFVALDSEGTELPDLEAARYHAVKGLRDIVATEVLSGKIPTYEYIKITDQAGLRLATVTFDDALTILIHKPR